MTINNTLAHDFNNYINVTEIRNPWLPDILNKSAATAVMTRQRMDVKSNGAR